MAVMDDSGPFHSIGDLARRTGLTVKTVRHWSDRGIVTPVGRTAAGYRRYSGDAVARLELVRTLRELGMDLATIRAVVDRERPLSEVAAEHAAALDVQIRVLQLRRAVLAAAAERGSGPEELTLVHQLARLSEDERRRLVRAFLDEVFHGLAADPAFTGIRRSLSPELPDDAGPEQVRAWVDLVELAGDPGFRSYMRQLIEEQSAGRQRRGRAAAGVSRDLAATVVQLAGPAVAAGIAPGSPEAAPYVAALEAGCAPFAGTAAPDGSDVGTDSGSGSSTGTGTDTGTALRTHLARRVEQLNDPRRERYVRLLATVNGWQEPPSLAPVLAWTAQALTAAAPAPAAPGTPASPASPPSPAAPAVPLTPGP